MDLWKNLLNDKKNLEEESAENLKFRKRIEILENIVFQKD